MLCRFLILDPIKKFGNRFVQLKEAICFLNGIISTAWNGCIIQSVWNIMRMRLPEALCGLRPFFGCWVAWNSPKSAIELEEFWRCRRSGAARRSRLGGGGHEAQLVHGTYGLTRPATGAPVARVMALRPSDWTSRFAGLSALSLSLGWDPFEISRSFSACHFYLLILRLAEGGARGTGPVLASLSQWLASFFDVYANAYVDVDRCIVGDEVPGGAWYWYNLQRKDVVVDGSVGRRGCSALGWIGGKQTAESGACHRTLIWSGRPAGLPYLDPFRFCFSVLVLHAYAEQLSAVASQWAVGSGQWSTPSPRRVTSEV